MKRILAVTVLTMTTSGCGGPGPSETFGNLNACKLLTTAARGTPIDPGNSDYKLTESGAGGNDVGSVSSCRTEWNPPKGKLTGANLSATLYLGESDDWSGHSEARTEGKYRVLKDTTAVPAGCSYQVQIPDTSAAAYVSYVDSFASTEQSCSVATRLVDQLIPDLP